MSDTYKRYEAEIEFVIAAAKRTGLPEARISLDRTECYAYPHPNGRISWGVNRAGDGVTILRGIRNLDGSDEGVV